MGLVCAAGHYAACDGSGGSCRYSSQCPEAPPVPSLTCGVPLAVTDGWDGVTRATGLCCRLLCVRYRCMVFHYHPVLLYLPRRWRHDRADLTGLLGTFCLCSAASRRGGVSLPGSGTGLLPDKSCNACSGDRGMCCGGIGETIWLACPSTVRGGVTGGSLLSVSGGLIRPKSAGSGRMGGAGGMTRLPAPETVWEVLLCTTLLPV